LVKKQDALQSNPPTVIKQNVWETNEFHLYTQKAAPNHKAVHLSIDLFDQWLQKALRE